MNTYLDTGRYTDLSTAASRSALAYTSVKRQLLSGAFPLGGRLAEERLARELDVSRTPVREALSRLHAEGLVERHPDGGYTPAVPDLTEIVELYEVRASLEQAALARPTPVDRDDLRVLRSEWSALASDDAAPGTGPDFVLLDEDFHLRLAAAAGNEALVAILAGVNDRIRVVRMHDFLTPERIEATIVQHLAILDAVLSGAGRLAAAVLAAHLDESAAIVQARAGEAIARMLGRRSTP